MNGFTTSERSRAQAWLIKEINDDVPKYMFIGTDNAPPFTRSNHNAKEDPPSTQKFNENKLKRYFA